MVSFNQLQTTTIREFDGGLNVVHDDLNMNTRYSTIETNVYNNINGTKAKRYGTKYFTDVKKYAQVEETFDSCDVIVDKTLTILQDTIHNVALEDKISIKSPDNLIGDYTVSELFTGTFYVAREKQETDNESYDITYIINDNENSLLSAKCTVYSDKLGIVRYKNDAVRVNKEIIITQPSTIAGTYTIINSNDDNFNIKLNNNVQETTFTDIKYKYNGEDVERYSTTSTLVTKNLLKFNYADHNSLLIGNTLKISSPDAIKGDYVIIDKDNEAYYVDITKTNQTQTQQNVQIVHDNRNIKGNRIINCEYFVDKMILVSDIGEIVAVDGTGNAIIIWNDTIAKNVNKEESIEGWHETTSVCFTVFNGILTVWNGSDKPLAIELDKKIPCNYLIDEGTGSNANVPIAKYALAFNHYLVCGNIFDELEGKSYPDRISISSRDTIGTFYSGDLDDIDNDAVYLDLGKIISSNKQQIKGISRYRNQIAVGFDDVTVFGTLGIYEDSTRVVGETEVTYKVHVPQFEDVIDNHGCISNRTFASLKSELVCLDYSGIPLFKKSTMSTQISPARISTQISPELYTKFIGLNENVIEDRIFSVINPKDNQYLLFIPNNNEYNDTTETVCYAYTLRSAVNSSVLDGAWSKFVGWNFQCGLTTALNEVILINGTKLYILGNIDRQYFADFIDDPDYPATDNEDISGKAINFEWELPWADFGNRAGTKHSRYFSISTTGKAQFNVDLYLDYIYTDVDGERDPQLSLNFVGGDSFGYGNGKQPYGAGRRTNSEFLFAYPAKFKIAKFNINGSSKEKLNINSFTIYYQSGNIRR